MCMRSEVGVGCMWRQEVYEMLLGLYQVMQRTVIEQATHASCTHVHH